VVFDPEWHRPKVVGSSPGYEAAVIS
jgi:hypothetical protein